MMQMMMLLENEQKGPSFRSWLRFQVAVCGAHMEGLESCPLHLRYVSKGMVMFGKPGWEKLPHREAIASCLPSPGWSPEWLWESHLVIAALVEPTDGKLLVF